MPPESEIPNVPLRVRCTLSALSGLQPLSKFYQCVLCGEGLWPMPHADTVRALYTHDGPDLVYESCSHDWYELRTNNRTPHVCLLALCRAAAR